MPRGIFKRKESKTETSCSKCGIVFSKYKNRVRKNNFCSKKCMLAYQIAENNPCYRGGVMKIKGYERYRVRKKELKKKGIDTSKSFHFLDWIKMKIEYNFTCLRCLRSEPEIHLTVDHIVPISKGGTDELSNIQPLCLSCNASKKCKTIKYEKR